jgi:hypothetical protein
MFDPSMARETLSLRGMSSKIEIVTDTYTLSMSYVPGISENSNLIKNDRFGLLTKDARGQWVKAVSRNTGGTLKYVVSP